MIRRASARDLQDYFLGVLEKHHGHDLDELAWANTDDDPPPFFDPEFEDDAAWATTSQRRRRR